MEAWRAPPEDLEAVRARVAPARPDADAFGVYADNWQSVNAFVALQTQWDRAAMDARRLGLKFDQALAWVETFIRRRHRRAVLVDLHTMELAVLQADNELREQEER